MSTAKNSEIVLLQKIKKDYGQGKVVTEALRGVDLKLVKGDFTVMMGPSGSGKSTLLNIIGGLDRATSGKAIINGQDIGSLSNKALSLMRRNNIGFVFQNYNLIPVMNLFQEIGLDGLENRFPRELSGGQQQRVAIARAVASNPQLVLADEITANVDSETAQSLLELMALLNKNNNTTFLFSTHDPAVIKFAKKIIVLKDGNISNEKLSSEVAGQYSEN